MSIRTPPPAPVLRKRKSVEDDAPFEHMPALPRVIKHPRRLETYQLDNDHSMSLSSFETNSEVAAGTSESPSPSFPSTPTTPPSEYPLIQLYPDFPDPNAMDVDQSLPENPSLEGVGLLGIQALGDKHNNCTQLPRLQVANYPGLEGRRALFTQCMQCGGISQVTHH